MIKTQKLTGKKNCIKNIQKIAKKHKKQEIGFLHDLKTYPIWIKRGYKPESNQLLVFPVDDSVILMWAI